MKTTGADNQNGSRESQWPGELKIHNNEFQQSEAVAQLATKLCELEHARSKIVKQPEEYLEKAWELIQKAREHVLEPQSVAEYLVAHGGSHEAGERAVGYILSASRVPFEKLCKKKPEEDPVTIYGKNWKVYRSKHGFYDLFWAYWNAISEIKNEDQRKDYGKKKLASWKRDGVPANTFLALARFRSEHDKRAANLPKKPKRGKHRQLRAKARA